MNTATATCHRGQGDACSMTAVSHSVVDLVDLVDLVDVAVAVFFEQNIDGSHLFVRRSNASRYFAAVAAMISAGIGGGGGFLSQSSVSR